MVEKRFHFHTVRQWGARLLLMFSLGIIGGKGDFDQPHWHSDSEPIFPTTIAPISVYGNTSATMLRFESRDYIPESERCASCAGIGYAFVGNSLVSQAGTDSRSDGSKTARL
jgi:hypothetical protein